MPLSKPPANTPPAPPPAASTHAIGAVERDTGIGKDTLRVWERRYQFPQPERDANGERVYPLEQVNKLRLLKRLIDGGHRPGKIIHLEVGELQGLSDGLAAGMTGTVDPVDRPDLHAYLELCREHRVEELRTALSQALLRTGLQEFVVEVIAPLTRIVGEYWARGLFTVCEEHLYTEVVQNLLRNAILQRQGHADARPRIMLTTFPQEQHGIGLLMAESIFALEGARCISLGVQTPIIDIILAAKTQQADIVALSFSSAMNLNQALDGLSQLRAGLPDATEIWIGGSNPALARRSRKAVRVVNLDKVPDELAAWSRRHGVLRA